MMDSSKNCNNYTSQCQLLKKINEYSLALVDTMLYLDTHPSDQKALTYYNEILTKYKDYHHTFSMQFYPLVATEVTCSNPFSWVYSPMPWEKEAN